MNEFKFDLGEKVKIVCSGESGLVTSKCASVGRSTQYMVRYKAADGRAVEQWWDEDALSSDKT
jgi:hypothetical protein